MNKNNYFLNIFLLFSLFIVSPCIAEVIIQPDKQNYIVGETIKVSFEGMQVANNAPNADWIGVFSKGAENKWENVILWNWVTTHTGNIQLSHQTEFKKQLSSGEYEIRAFFDNSFIQQAATSFSAILPDNRYLMLSDQSGGITQGYGSWGATKVKKIASYEVVNKGKVTVYRPDTNIKQYPTIFFISGWQREAETYGDFFRFIVSKGYVVVHVLNTNPGSINSSYPNAFDMIVDVQQHYSEWINTRKVAVMGHSFGGGATVWVANKLFGNKINEGDKNWGEDGRFIYATDPWYTFKMSKADLNSFPLNTKLLFQLSTKNPKIDPRAIRAVFRLINIPDSDKDFVMVNSDVASYVFDGKTYHYDADHYISYTGAKDQWDGGLNRPYDALDVFAINRPVDAMLDYVFNKNPLAKNMALGNGSTEQIDMGFLTDLSVSDYPVFNLPSSDYHYKCPYEEGKWSGNKSIWKLTAYCDESSVNSRPAIIIPILRMLLDN